MAVVGSAQQAHNSLFQTQYCICNLSVSLTPLVVAYCIFNGVYTGEYGGVGAQLVF